MKNQFFKKTGFGVLIAMLFTTMIFMSVSCCKEDPIVEIPEIGQEYKGGIVGYIFQDGDPGYVASEIHGIIISDIDQSDGITWGDNTVFAEATGTGLGDGGENTLKIVNTYGAGSYAAKLCWDLNYGGYDDWVLPSIDEMGLIRLNIPLGSMNYYWSSTEINSTDAQTSPSSGALLGKENTYRVRAIRYF